jgi:hypothetical protein
MIYLLKMVIFHRRTRPQRRFKRPFETLETAFQVTCQARSAEIAGTFLRVMGMSQVGKSGWKWLGLKRMNKRECIYVNIHI